MKVAKKLETLAPYEPTIEKFDVVLDANESFLEPQGKLLEKIEKALSSVSFNRYPDPTAKELCAAAASCFGVKPEQVVAGNGSDELISIIISNMIETGGKVVISAPDFSMYAFYASLAELKVISAGKNGLFLDADAMINAVRENDADLLIFSNPCNPSGQGLKREEVIRVIENCDSIVIVDEAYMEFWDQSVLDLVGKYPNLMILKTCSKAFGLAAARCGFAIGDKPLIDNIKKAKSPYNVNSFTQAAALEILKDSEYINSSISAILKSRDDLYKALDEIGVNPIACNTNFVLVKLPNAREVWLKLREKGISVRNIMGDYLRITAGSDDENKRVVSALKEVL